MSKTISVKRKVGRPATGTDRLIAARMSDHLIARIEAWAEAQEVGRSEAIRRLIERGLKGKG